MMHGSLLRLLGFGCAVVLAGACANGDDPSSGFSISGVNPTQPTQSGTNPTSESASSTGGTTGGTTTGAPATTTGVDPTTTSVSGTTTGVDPSTTTGVDPSTTTGVDPSTTTTGVDPSTTTGVDPSTTTGDPPPPPPKDPQPNAGLYEACLDNTPCDANTDGCFTLTDANMNVTDGYCTLLCDSVADCGAKPVCPAVQECLNIAPAQNVCALKCAGVKDCPTGMACINISLPNNGSGMYCF